MRTKGLFFGSDLRRLELKRVIVLRPPETLIALDGTNEPRLIASRVRAEAPVFLVVVVRRQKTATRDRTKSPGKGVEDGVAHDTSDQTVRDGVRERHEHESDESWDGIAGVVPVDGCHTTHHHAADKDQSTTSRPRWDGSEDGCKEQGDEEADTCSHGCEAGTTTFLDTRTRLDESSDRRGAEKGADGDGEGISAVGDGALGEVTSVRIDDTRETSHRV